MDFPKYSWSISLIIINHLNEDKNIRWIFVILAKNLITL
jgi:hypothetical protein